MTYPPRHPHHNQPGSTGIPAARLPPGTPHWERGAPQLSGRAAAGAGNSETFPQGRSSNLPPRSISGRDYSTESVRQLHMPEGSRSPGQMLASSGGATLSSAALGEEQSSLRPDFANLTQA